MGLERMRGGERKEEGFIIKTIYGSRTFLLGYAENACVFGTFRGLVRMREGERKEGKKRTLYEAISTRSQIFTFYSVVYDAFTKN